MAASFFYNGENIFEGLAYTPIVEREVDSVYVNGRINIVDRIILRGRIVEACKVEGIWVWVDEIEDPIITEFGDFIIFNDQKGLWGNSVIMSQEIISKFSENFKQFQIREGLVVEFNANQAIVRSINFEQNKWVGLTPYEIVIECYRQNYADIWGILEPSAEFSYQQNENKTVSYNATVSARGINTSNKAIQNAINFVNSYTLNPEFASVFPEFTEYAGFNTFLRQKRTDIDRLSGLVTRNESYIYNENLMNTLSFQNGVLEFQTQLSKDEQGIFEIVINGSLTGSLTANLQLMVADIRAYNWYEIANSLYRRETGLNLPTNPLQFSSDLNFSEKIVNFAITYSSQKENNIYIIDSTTISRNFEENSTCISVSLTFKKDFGCSKVRWQDLQNYYKNFNFNQYIQQKWNKYVNNSTIGNNFSNQSYSENEFSGEIQTSATYCTNFSENCDCLSKFDYSLNWELPIKRYIQKDTYKGEGCYYVEKMNVIPRGQFQIQGNATPTFCCSFEETVSEIKSKINILVNKFFPGSNKILKASEITEDKNGRNISFSTSLDGEQNEFFANIPFPSLSGIVSGDGRSMVFSVKEGVIIDSSNRVEQWNDLSGNGFHAIQSVNANKPILFRDEITRRQSVLFDGINDFLEITAPDLVRNRGYCYIVANIKYSNLNTAKTILNVATPLITNSRVNLWITDSNRFSSFYRTNDAASGSFVTDSESRIGNNVIFAKHLFSNGSSSIQVGVNLKNETLYSNTSTSNTASIQTRIGNQNGSNSFNGKITCLAVICPPSALTENEEILLKQWAASHTGVISV